MDFYGQWKVSTFRTKNAGVKAPLEWRLVLFTSSFCCSSVCHLDSHSWRTLQHFEYLSSPPWKLQFVTLSCLLSHPGYFGKVGMRHYHLKRNTTHCPTINLDKLWTLVSEQTRLNYGKKPEGPAPIIDAVRAVSIGPHVCFNVDSCISTSVDGVESFGAWMSEFKTSFVPRQVFQTRLLQAWWWLGLLPDASLT